MLLSEWMAYSRKVHNSAASSLMGYFSEREIDSVNRQMDSGVKRFGPRHQSLDEGHAVFRGVKKGETLPVRVVHGLVDAGAAIALAGEKATFGACRRPKIFTRRN